MAETTSLGAALAAAKTVGLWSVKDRDEGQTEVSVFRPEMEASLSDRKFKRWGEAIQRSLNWE